MPRSLSDWLIEKVTINLGGREWRLAVTYGILLECQDATGIDMLHTVEILANPTATALRAFLSAILRRCDEGLSVWRVGSLITSPGDISAVKDAIGKAYLASMPGPEARRKKNAGGEEIPEPPPMSRIQMRSAARIELGLSDEEWLNMTPCEFHALREAYVKRERHSELMLGQLIAAVKNHSMNPPRKPAQASDFVLHRIPADEPENVRGYAQIDSRTGAISFEA